MLNKNIIFKEKKIVNKKGMSPLLTTFFLIAIVITIGVLFTSMGNIEKECTSEEIEILTVGTTKFACFDNENLKFVLRNKGSKTIEKLTITINGETTSFNQQIKPGMLDLVSFHYTQDVNELTITPNNCKNKIIKTSILRCIN